jgi:hypothetical protein
MSTQLAEQPVADQPQVEKTVAPVPFKPRGGNEDFSEFNYRPVPMVAVAGFALALISFGGIFIWLALPLCLVAAIVCLMALVSIRRSNGEFGGGWLSATGLLLSIAFFVSGITWQVYAYQTELPEGFQRVSFVNDISAKEFIQTERGMDVHPDVRALEGKKVFLKGFMYPTQTFVGLQTFLLIKDNNQCCFGGKPAIQDRLGVVFDEGVTADYYAGRVSIAGTFQINPKFDGSDDLMPLYMVKAERFYKAKSDF